MCACVRASVCLSVRHVSVSVKFKQAVNKRAAGVTLVDNSSHFTKSGDSIVRKGKGHVFLVSFPELREKVTSTYHTKAAASSQQHALDRSAYVLPSCSSRQLDYHLSPQWGTAD